MGVKRWVGEGSEWMSLMGMFCNLGGRGMCMYWARHKTSLRRTEAIRLHTTLPWSQSILHLSAVQEGIQDALGLREIHSARGKASFPEAAVYIAFYLLSCTTVKLTPALSIHGARETSKIQERVTAFVVS